VYPSPGDASDRASLALLSLLGLGAGVSPLLQAYYGTGVWIPIGLAIVVAAAIGVVARPPVLGRPAIVALSALGALGLWSLLSSAWSPAAEQAVVDANRWLVYAALLLLALVLITSRRHAVILVAAIGVGIGIAAAVVLVRLLGAGGPAMFVEGRLDLPLGYVNGQGCVFAMGCWLTLALAESRRPAPAALGAGGTVVLAGLALLTQSRGAAIATAVAVVVALTAFPGARRRVLALATVAVATGLATSRALRVYSATGPSGRPPAHVLHEALLAILLAGAGAAVVWGLAVAAARAISARGERSERLVRRAATVAAVAAIALPAIAAVVRVGSIERTVRHQWHAFVHLSGAGSGAGADSPVQTRLLSGAGNRYDFWRIAWHQFTAHPLAGAGAGGYPVAYYAQRRTDEAIENPHSLELELLAELGVIGGALLVTAIVAVVLGGRLLRAAARRSLTARGLLVASGGVALTWLVTTSGDWMHLLPGVTAIALLAVAALLATERAAAPEARPLRTAGVLAAAVVLALAGGSLVRSGASQIYLDAARGEVAAHPAAALGDANRALRFDAANLDSYYVKAAALARFDRAAAARRVLLQAVRQQPSSFVTWTLLGDLAVRTGDLASARRYYGRARALDPRDPTLARLVRNPRSALAGRAG
jgi:O-antigen ligase